LKKEKEKVIFLIEIIKIDQKWLKKHNIEMPAMLIYMK
jgi:hypothetical protein